MSRASGKEARLSLLDPDVAVPVLVDRLSHVQKRQRSRLLDEDDVRIFVRRVCAAMTWAAAHDVPVEDVVVKVDGGDVARSYGYTAYTSVLSLQCGEIMCARTHTGRATGIRIAPSHDGVRDVLREQGIKARGGHYYLNDDDLAVGVSS